MDSLQQNQFANSASGTPLIAGLDTPWASLPPEHSELGLADADPRAFNLDRAAYSLDEVAALLSVSKGMLYREINDGRLVRTKRRGRSLITAPHLINYLTSGD